MSLPKIDEIIGGYRFAWTDEMIGIEVTRIHQHSEGRVTGEIAISTTMPGTSPHLHQAIFNFSSTRSRKELARTLEERLDTIDWYIILEQLSVYTLDRVRRGQPLIIIDTEQEAPPTDYLLHPVLPMNMPAIIYGEGGVGKGYLALLFGLCVLLPWEDNPFHLQTKSRPTKILYLDWETDQEEIRRRLKYMTTGLGLGYTLMEYRRCDLPLADDVARIQSAVAESQASLTIIDSLGPASGGDLNNADTALRLYTALRQLHTTPLLISHPSKSSLIEHKTPFGSVYFYNLARSVWEVKKVQQTGRAEFDLGMFHRKSNISQLYHPLGFHFAFGDCSVSVRPEEVSSVAEFEELLSPEMRIRSVLRQEPLTPKELSDATGINPSTVRSSLKRMKDENKVVKVGERYGLQSEFPDT